MSSKKAGTGKLASTAAKSALILGASLGMMGISSPSFAQDAEAEEEDEAIVVTGTRIRQRDFQSTSPIATVGAEEIALSGTINVEELINSLPQVLPGVTVTSNNPSLNGFATADLRGMGPGRTLILINGRRANPSSSSGLVDLNTIPAALIERIELITGGASAVYGADAVAGAINFILRDDFEGMEANMSYGSTEDGLAPEIGFDVALGTPFADGRGHISLFAGYYHREPVLASERPWSANARTVMADPTGARVSVGPGFVRPAGWSVISGGGSGTAPWAQVTSVGTPFSIANIALASGLTLDNDCFAGNGVQPTNQAGAPANNGQIRFNTAGGIEPFQSCAIFNGSGPAGSEPDAAGDVYDFSSDNYLILENERINIAAFGEYEINDAVTAFIEASYTNSRSVQQLAATPVTNLRVNVDLDRNPGTTVINPYVSANAQLLNLLNLTYPGGLDQTQLNVNIRPNQGGFRVGTNDTNAIGVTGGFRGTFDFSDLDWEVFASYARNQTTVQSDNNVGATAIRQLMNNCNTTTLAPQAQPFSALPNCPFPGNTSLGTFVPTGNTNNPLGLNAFSPAMLNFIRVNTTDVITYERSIIGGFVAGDAADLWGAGPIGFAAGFEYRQEQLDSRPDAAKQAGDIFGFNAQEAIAGRYDVYELFGEFTVPIISNQPFVHYLGFEGGYRFSDYSTGAGRTDTYKAGLEYSPVEWLTFRGIYNRAVRAPSAFELFRAGDQNFPAATDPCNASSLNTLAAGPALTAITATCAAWFASAGAAFPNAAGVPGAFSYQQVNQQIQSFSFGNSNLQPEVADSYTFGVVFNPDWWPVGRLGMSVDWFNLDLQDRIGSLSIAQTFANCTNAGGVGPNCTGFVPRRADGQIDFINLSLDNFAGHSQIQGVDTNVRWAYDVEGFGTIGVATLVTWYDPEQTTGAFSGIGFHFGGIGQGLAEWRAATSFTYDNDALSVLLRWSWTDEMTQFSFQGTPTEPVEAYSLWTLGGSYDLNDNVSISGTIDNLFDQEPQVFAQATAFGQFSVDGSSQDQLGRSYRVALRLRY